MRVQCRDALEAASTIDEVEEVVFLAQMRVATNYQFDPRQQQEFVARRDDIVRSRRRREERHIARAKKRLRKHARAECVDGATQSHSATSNDAGAEGEDTDLPNKHESP